MQCCCPVNFIYVVQVGPSSPGGRRGKYGKGFNCQVLLQQLHPSIHGSLVQPLFTAAAVYCHMHAGWTQNLVKIEVVSYFRSITREHQDRIFS